MNIYHAWCDLKPGVRDTDFSDGVAQYMQHLRAQGLIESWRLTRRKLGFAPTGFGEFHVTIEFQDMAQLDRAFGQVAERSEPTEGFHFGVNSLAQNVRFARYRDFPACSAGGKTRAGSVRLVPIVGGAGVDLQRHIQRHRRVRRLLHHALHHGDRRLDFLDRHFEDQFVVHLQEHLRAQLGLLQLRLDADHGAADDVGGRALQARIDGRALVEGADRGFEFLISG